MALTAAARSADGRICVNCRKAFDPNPSERKLLGVPPEKAATETLYQYAVDHGATILRHDAIAKVRHGLTTLEEAMRVTVGEL